MLANSLRKLRIKSVITDVPQPQRSNLPVYSLSKIIILCLERETTSVRESILALVNNPLHKGKKFVKVLLSKSPNEKLYDPLPDLHAIAKFNFTSKDSSEIKRFEEFIKSETKKLREVN